MKRNTVTASVRPVTPRASAAERRAAEIATLSNKQAELKHEAAERRRAREQQAAKPGKGA
ncbi:MAG TPA: hypothetical protein VG223_08505 [Solirubrobacteraceae bacterium]|jgi:hypothetical protein|nr:hypothetical protein [Solirubrobacteraceae bacterium]